ncbi:MAG: NAD+ synthase, partial [Thermoleophilia bacterium]|nr:NAD+ synthase [Thermoleophilia bacterium]
MRIALAQINPTVGDLKGNGARITEWAAKAAQAGATVVAFPELAICGYPPEDLVLKDYFLADCRDTLADVAADCADVVALVGIPLRENGSVYNAVAVLAGGRVAGWYRKIRLPNYAVFDEKRYFTPGKTVTVVELGKTRLGITICEDIWEEIGPAEVAAGVGDADVILNLSMSPYHAGKGKLREAMLSERARTAGACVCYVNGIGGQDELVFDGQSLAFDPRGGLVARAAQFEEELVLVDVDTGQHPRMGKAGVPSAWPVEIIALGGP